jgi:CSLREA domain-containing protein
MNRRLRSGWFALESAFGRSGSKRKQLARRLGRTLWVERLEARQLLTGVTVGNSSDVVNGVTTSIADLIATPGADGISLREAIIAANYTAGQDSIAFAAGVTGGNIVLTAQLPTITGSLVMNGTVTIRGNGNRSLEIGAGADVNVTGVSITNGTALRGAAIYNAGTLSLTNGNFDGNYATISGGAIYNAGTLTMTNCTANANIGDQIGGAIYNAAGATLTATAITASGNFTQGDGGAIYNAGTLNLIQSHRGYNPAHGYSQGPDDRGLFDNTSEDRAGAIFNSSTGNATLTDVSMLWNTASSYGGGIFNEGTMTVNGIIGPTEVRVFSSGNDFSRYTKYVLAYNDALYGGGVYNSGTLAMNGCSIVTNTTFSGPSGVENTGTLNLRGTTIYQNGGFGVASYGTLTVVNSTVAGNVSHGIFNTGFATVTNSTVVGNGGKGVQNVGVLTLNNNILAGNSTGDFGGGVPSGQQNFVADGSGIGLAGTISGNPMLGPLTFANGGPAPTMRPLAGSPVINAGNNGLLPSGVTTDQRGAQRIKNGAVEMGAVEIGAETIVVTTLADEDNGTIDAAQGTGTSLREAIHFVNTVLPADGATITFAPGVAGTIAPVGQSLPTISSQITIAGPGAAVLVIDGDALSGVGQGGILRMSSDYANYAVAISGLTFRNGSAGQGGAIYASGFQLTLTDCAFMGNTAVSTGGAVHGSNLTVIDCSFVENTVVGANFIYEGGGAIFSSGNLTVANSTFSGNSSNKSGGAIAFQGAAATMTGSTFSGNSAGTNGGAIYNARFGDATTATTIDGSTFSNNSAAFGGAICNDSGYNYRFSLTSLTVRNSTLDENLATQRGGAIYNSVHLTVAGSTLTRNSSLIGGGGIDSGAMREEGNAGEGVVTVRNSIIDSTAGADLLTNPGYSGTLTGSCNFISDGSGSLPNTITGDPMLGPLKNNGGPTKTRAPLYGSPVIDAGNNALIPSGVTTDQRGLGFPRVIGGTVNLGAVESNPNPPVPGDFDSDGDVDGADFVIWQSNFSKASGGTLATGDADGDTDVDGADFVVWQTHFPTSAAGGTAGAAGSAPETSSGVPGSSENATEPAGGVASGLGGAAKNTNASTVSVKSATAPKVSLPSTNFLSPAVRCG